LPFYLDRIVARYLVVVEPKLKADVRGPNDYFHVVIATAVRLTVG
jgi:hypothetical protein